jgi:hypothetical protein
VQGAGKPVLVLLLMASAAVAGAESACLSWDRIGNQPFRLRLDRLAGEHAVDCGYLALTRKPPRRERRAVLECIAGAQRRGEAFKFATSRMPGDSITDEVYVQTATGQAWMLVYDQMPLDDFAKYWVRSCEAVEVDRATLIISGKGCSDHMDGSSEEE